jgi:hypothetical protein
MAGSATMRVIMRDRRIISGRVPTTVTTLSWFIVRGSLYIDEYFVNQYTGFSREWEVSGMVRSLTDGIDKERIYFYTVSSGQERRRGE